MDGQPTSTGIIAPDDHFAHPALAAEPTGVIGRWRAVARFVRHPVLPDRATISLSKSVRALGPLLLLDLILMALVIGGLAGAQALGFQMPEHMLNEMQLGPLLLAFVVVGAPVIEEILFRGWLSGRAGHVLAVLGIVAGLIALMGAGAMAPGMTGGLVGAGGVVLGLIVAAVVLWIFRGRPAMGFFQRHFGWFYYAAALAFAALHLTNFAAAGASAAVLPLVIPQFVLALLLGYLRVNYGLATSMALHMMHNAFFIGLVLAAGGG